MKLILSILLLFSVSLNAQTLVIGIDGLMPNYIDSVETPFLDSLSKIGIRYDTVKAYYPTKSGPNWTSAFTGKKVEEHKVFDNETMYIPSKYDVLSLIAQQNKIAVFHQWKDFDQCINTEVLDTLIGFKNYKKELAFTKAFIPKHKPDLLIIHINAVDMMGHIFGYGSNNYRKVIGLVDQELRKTFSDINFENILVLSDHGGIKKSHGEYSKQERFITWIWSNKTNAIEEPKFISDAAKQLLIPFIED